MSKVVHLSEFSEKPENIYLKYMTAFWDENDLYWQLSNGGFELWSVYVDARNKIHQSDLKTLAAAANLLIIEYNKNRILEEGHVLFHDHLLLLSTYYEINPNEITELAVKLSVSMLKVGFDATELKWDDEAEDNDLYVADDLDIEAITPEMRKSGMEIMQTQCNLQVTIEFGSDTPITKDQCTQVITDMLEDNKYNITTKLYTICVNENYVTFSLDCQLGFIFLFIEIMKNKYRVTPEFVVVRDIDENAYEPEMHYSSFIQFYRDMVKDDFEGEEDLSRYIEKFSSLSLEERRRQNPNARDDDEYAAIELFNLPQEEGVAKAEKMLKTNPHNIEAQILKAGWEGDLEKRIDMLLDIANVYNLGYDYKRIQKDKMWWKASHTRPFMRAKFLLAKTYEIGGYLDDALDGYKEIINMNPDDNLGARLEMMMILYQLGDKKAIVSLSNAFPNEEDEYFVFAAVYGAFMKYGKSSKTDKKIMFSVQINHYLACAIAKIDTVPFNKILASYIDVDELLFKNSEKCKADIMTLFKNVELVKYYRKVVQELLDRIGK
ncbi:MAG: hypothetical protein IPN86_18275 [Saprospiraceae bacterium]|nr:hypothetical protein [Saprospiraceae bacterium]